MAGEEKIAHLGFIQGVINRMGSNSFLIKGWAIALVAATFTLSPQYPNSCVAFIAFFLLIFFWWLDGFFLHQEKLYRKLYEKVAVNTEPSTEFSMDTNKYKREVDCLRKVLVSKSLT
jgi:hypothetical protein